MSAGTIGIVVPVYNEQDALEELVREIDTVADTHQYDLRVLFVDDGSRDASWNRIVALARANPRIGGLRFFRNSGKAAALMAGFSAIDADYIFMMDADLQDPPVEIPRFLDKMAEGYDVVSGWKQRRHDPWHKVYPSRVFNWMIGALTGVELHDHVCGFKCFRRDAAKSLRIDGELHRFLGVLSAAKGYRVTEIPTLHRARTTGVSKYGLSRFAKGFLDLLTIWVLTGFRCRPQHAIGGAGLVVIALALLSWIPRLHWLLWPLPGVAAGLVLIGLGVVSAQLAAAGPMDELYRVIDSTGWCSVKAGKSELRSEN